MPCPVVSYWIAASRSPRAFAAADSLPFEIHGDGVGAGVGGPHRLQGPANSNTANVRGKSQKKGHKDPLGRCPAEK